jgi:hypothetical protein
MSSQVSSVPQLITILQSATPTEAADILSILQRGHAMWTDRQAEAETAAVTPVKIKTVKEPAAPKKEKAAKAEKAEKPAIALPEAAEGTPQASEYRVDSDMFDSSTCIARITKGGEDKRWKPIIFRESQCGGKLVEGSDLCAKCCKREEKYAADPKPGDWCGRLSEEPLDWQHMLGTAWAEEKKPRFLGASAVPSGATSVADEVASENGSAQEMPAPKKPDAAAKAAKLAEKESAKAAKLAEKESAKAIAVAAKAEKAAAAAAEKAAKVAEKAAAKEAKAVKAKATDAAVVKAVKTKTKKEAVVVAAAPVEVEGELKLIDGTLYMVKKGNVFEYDELTEKAGDFVGRITADETIDTEAEEVTIAESDTD